MTTYVCVTCGAQFAPTSAPPPRCPVCEDIRQYLPPGGQRWITFDAFRRQHRNAFQYETERLLGIGTTPAFAIGQRALLVRAASGNVLWDCVTLVDDATHDLVSALGGLSAIAISHPHYYSGMIEWSRAFGDIPIHLHEDDRAWVMYPHRNIHFWSGDTLPIAHDLTLIRCGGHFTGATVLHWTDGADGRGELLAGDVLQVTQDLKYVSFMYSYPNYIPLPAARVESIAARLEPYAFERIHGAWWGRSVMRDGKPVLRDSVRRYVDALHTDLSEPSADHS